MLRTSKNGLRLKLDGGHDFEEQSKLASQTAEEIPQIGREIEIEMMGAEPSANGKVFEKNIESESGSKSHDEEVKVAEIEDKIRKHQYHMDFLKQNLDDGGWGPFQVQALTEKHRFEMDTLKRDLDQGAWELFAKIFEIESSAKRIQTESKCARDELEAKLEKEREKVANILSLQEEKKIQHNEAIENLRLKMRAIDDKVDQLQAENKSLENLLQERTTELNNKAQQLAMVIAHLEGRVTEKELQIGNLQVNVVIIHSQVNIQSEHEVSARIQTLNASFIF